MHIEKWILNKISLNCVLEIFSLWSYYGSGASGTPDVVLTFGAAFIGLIVVVLIDDWSCVGAVLFVLDWTIGFTRFHGYGSSPSLSCWIMILMSSSSCISPYNKRFSTPTIKYGFVNLNANKIKRITHHLLSLGLNYSCYLHYFRWVGVIVFTRSSWNAVNEWRWLLEWWSFSYVIGVGAVAVWHILIWTSAGASIILVISKIVVIRTAVLVIVRGILIVVGISGTIIATIAIVTIVTIVAIAITCVSIKNPKINDSAVCFMMIDPTWCIWLPIWRNYWKSL